MVEKAIIFFMSVWDVAASEVAIGLGLIVALIRLKGYEKGVGGKVKHGCYIVPKA